MEIQPEERRARPLHADLTHQLAVPIENEQLTEGTHRRGWSKRCHINVAMLVRGNTFGVRVACRQRSERFNFTAIPRGALKREQHKRGQQRNTDKAKRSEERRVGKECRSRW